MKEFKTIWMLYKENLYNKMKENNSFHYKKNYQMNINLKNWYLIKKLMI